MLQVRNLHPFVRDDVPLSSIKLGEIIARRHNRALADLLDARSLIDHPSEKGGVTEGIWLDLFDKYLPKRYQARRAMVVDHRGQLSNQIDIVVHDGLFTPFILDFGGYEIVPIESVYAVFEVKQAVNIANLVYAEEKCSSVTGLIRVNRETRQVRNIEPTPIRRGLLATQCDWSQGEEEKIFEFRSSRASEKQLEYIVSAESFSNTCIEGNSIHDMGRAAISRFLLRFVEDLQAIGTVMPIDIEKYLQAI